MEASYSHLYEEVQTIKSSNLLSVVLAIQKSSRQFFIVKKANIYELEQESQDYLFNQSRLLKNLNHPHILRYKDIFLEGEHLIQILQYCEQGDLAHYLKRRMERKEFLSQKLILNWLLQILMGLQYIHQKKIIHRGIRLKNIYINSKGNLKLGAFGQSKVLNQTFGKAISLVGSPQTMSPEMMEEKPYDSKTDIWSVGCLLFELCTYKGIFSHLSLAQMYEHIVEAKVPDLPIEYSKYLQPIYKKLMKKNPMLRTSAEEVLRTPIFLKLMEQYLKKKKIDSIQIKNIPIKKLMTHEKLKEKKKDKTILPKLKSKHQSKSIQKLSSNINSPNSSKIQKKSPIIFPKTPQINLKKLAKKQQDNDAEIEEERLTKRTSQQYELSLQKLYQMQIMIICKQLQQKYSPKMQKILEKTLQYQPE